MKQQGRGGHWNRAGRKSGGFRPRQFPLGHASQIGPPLSLACFETRHRECPGNCKPLLPFSCGCECHQVTP